MVFHVSSYVFEFHSVSVSVYPRCCTSSVLSVCAKMFETCKRPVCKIPLFVPSNVFVALWNVHLGTHRLSFNNVQCALPFLTFSLSLSRTLSLSRSLSFSILPSASVSLHSFLSPLLFYFLVCVRSRYQYTSHNVSIYVGFFMAHFFYFNIIKSHSFLLCSPHRLFVTLSLNRKCVRSK